MSEFFTEEVLGKKMVCLRIWKKNSNGLMNLLTSTTFCVCLNVKFDDEFTLKGRFDSGKTRAHYVLMPLRDPAHWSCYNRLLQGSNMSMAEVVVENGYKMQGVQDGPSIDGVGGNEQELEVEGEATQGNMDLNGQLTQEQFHSSQVGCISNDFDVNEFEWEEEEEEDRIGDVVCSDSDDSDNDQMRYRCYANTSS